LVCHHNADEKGKIMSLVTSSPTIWKGLADMLDHATKKIPGECFKRSWPPLIKMDAAVKAKVEKLFGGK